MTPAKRGEQPFRCDVFDQRAPIQAFVSPNRKVTLNELTYDAIEIGALATQCPHPNRGTQKLIETVAAERVTEILGSEQRLATA
jgi:hypothetical protein